MHELSIVEGLMGIIRETAGEHGLTRVTRVKLRIGAMRQVVPDALRFAFEVTGKDTVAEGAEIVITDVPTKAHCNDCGSDFAVEEFCFVCTACGSGQIDVTEGKELYIDSLEGE
ncbi:MAG: hydrogenase maturation nickel metallochaperone HypA [Chitinispirillaceae bacterium]|nr:hydrogenase maturation nickel metallochaperone HypA [Chitinispirillaceae bacterium]